MCVLAVVQPLVHESAVTNIMSVICAVLVQACLFIKQSLLYMRKLMQTILFITSIDDTDANVRPCRSTVQIREIKKMTVSECQRCSSSSRRLVSY